MKIMKYFCLGLLITAFFSCDRYLEPKINNQYGDDITWKLPDYAMKIIAEGYAAINALTCGYNGNNYLDAVTDNSLTTQSGSSFYDYVFGSQSIHSDPIGNWGTAYNTIALMNLFLEKGLSDDIIYSIASSTTSEALRRRSKGEAYFLRAWWQHELLRTYGGLSTDGKALGYIIVTRTFHEDERESVNLLPRNTFEECVRQIFDDCDTAYVYLPLQFNPTNDDDPAIGLSQFGRASRKAVLALKSRVALLAASPAYQPAGISDNEIREKWLRAATMAQDAITEVNSNAGANTMVALSPDMLVGANVTNANHTNSLYEILFRRYANNSNTEQNHYPAAWHGNAKCNPSQNLVNAYPMENGYPITDPRSGYDAQNPYANRDARLRWQINYNGESFNDLPDERALEIYAASADGSVGHDAPGFDYRNTWTGYYLRKGMSNVTTCRYNPSNPGATQSDHHCNPLLRRAEIWLNLAEACNELAGPAGTVPGVDADNTPVAIIKALRTLYGTGNAYVDDVAALNDKEAFRGMILSERRLEFAFENMRFWDIRRRKLPQLSESILGIKIYKGDNDKYVYFGTTPGEDDIVVQDRSALSDEKYYTSPIPYAEIVKNKNLVQNAGW